MNEDAFARRFYADRAELESLGIQLSVDKPMEGMAEQESYTLPPENFYLPAIEFTDSELAALQTALSLLDGEFAYAEPLRLALQQLSWGRPSPLRSPAQQSIALGITASAGGHDLSQRLVKVETAISRRKTITFDYYTMDRDEVGERKVDPYQLLFQGGQFYLVGHSHERGAMRVFRLSRIRGKVAYATKAEHDFQRPEADDFDPRVYADRVGVAVRRRRGRRRGPHPRADRLAGRAPLRPLRRASTTRACSSRRTPTPASSCPGSSGWASTPARRPARAGRRAGRARRSARAPAHRRSRPGRRAAGQVPGGGGPGAGRAGRRRRPPRRRHPPRALRAPGHARLDPHRGRARGPPAARPRRSGSACRSPTRSCARTSRCSTSSTSAPAPTSSTPRSAPTARSRSTPTPTPTPSPARPACCRSRPRRWWRRST